MKKKKLEGRLSEVEIFKMVSDVQKIKNSYKLILTEADFNHFVKDDTVDWTIYKELCIDNEENRSKAKLKERKGKRV